MSGLEIRKSAVARLQAVGMLYTTASRRRALTSTSWGSGWSGSPEEDQQVGFAMIVGDEGDALGFGQCGRR